MKPIKAFILSTIALLILGQSPSFSQNFTKSPYVLMPGETKMIIRWELDSPAACVVNYGVAENELVHKKNGRTRGIKENRYLYEVKLDGLIPGQRYDYQVSAGTSTSESAHFTTFKRDEKNIHFISYSSLDIRRRKITGEIVSLLNSHGAKAIGLNGKDAHFITARPKEHSKWGLTGTITNIKADVVHKMIKEKFIPVIAPVAADSELSHPGYNINADLAASKIAAAIGARKIIFLTDTQGVLDKEGNLLRTLIKKDVDELKEDGTIYGGMLPKVDACLEALNLGVKKSHIIDGRVEHAVLLEILTSEGVGTQITLTPTTSGVVLDELQLQQ
jgi:acetylglutamate kinase